MSIRKKWMHSQILHKDNSYRRSRELIENLKKLIPDKILRLQFKAIGSKIISSTIRGYRKDVTAKLYGGDVTRKMKLLKKQKEGRKNEKIGNVEIPKKHFISSCLPQIKSWILFIVLQL